MGSESEPILGEYINVLDFGTIGSGRGKRRKSSQANVLRLVSEFSGLFHIGLTIRQREEKGE